MELLREINQRVNNEIAIFEELSDLYANILMLTEQQYEGGIDWEKPNIKIDKEAIRQSVKSTGAAERTRREQAAAPTEGDIVRTVVNGKPVLGRVTGVRPNEVIVDFPSIGKKQKMQTATLTQTDIQTAISKIKRSNLDPKRRDALLAQYQRIADIVRSRKARLFAVAPKSSLGLAAS